MEQSRIEDQIQSSLDGQTYELPEDPLASRLEKLIQELIDKGGGGGGTTIAVDSALSLTSKNPVQNKVITEALNELQDSVDNLTEIPDMGTDDANDIFNFLRASGTSTKYQIGIYKAGASNTPDSTKDWLIISFIGPAPDYISDQIALTYGGTEKPEVYLRAHASGTWTDWGKISGDVKANSATDDGIVKKGTGNQWNFWGTNQSGDPDWRTPLYLALQDQLSVYQDPSANTTVTGPNRGIKASTVTNEVLKQDGFTIDQIGYQDGLVLAFTNSMSQMSEILFTWEKGNVYYRVKATVSDWSDWVLIASKDPLLTENSKDKDGIVPKGNNNIWKIWETDQNGNPGWRDSLYTKIQSFSYPVLNGGMAFNPTTGPTGSDASAVKFFKVLPEHFKAMIVGSDGKPFEENNVNGGIGIAYIAAPSIVETVISSDTSKMYSHNRTSQTGTGNFSDWIELATVGDIDTAISNLIDGAPETLDTLNELAQALKDNQDVVDVLNDAIANKVDKIEGKGLSTNDYTDADKAASNAQADWNVTSVTSPAYILNKPDLSEIGVQSDWNVTATTSPAYILNKPGAVTQTEDGFVNAPGPYTEDPNTHTSDKANLTLSIDNSGNPVWALPERLKVLINNYFPESEMYKNGMKLWGLRGDMVKLPFSDDGLLFDIVGGGGNYTYQLFLKSGVISESDGSKKYDIYYRTRPVPPFVGNKEENWTDWKKLTTSEDLSDFLPLTGGVISTDGMELEINGFGITGNEAQDITGFDVIKGKNLKGNMIFYNNQDTDKRYIKTDSLPINTSTISGAVLAGVDNPNKIWGTDQNGNPGWVSIPSSETVIEEDPVNNLDNFVEGNEFKLGKFSNSTGSTPSSKPCLVMSFSSENGSYQLALDVAQNVFIRRQYGYGNTSWLPWDQVNMDRVENEATPNNLITKAHVRVGRYLSETDGDHWNAEEFPTPNFGGFIISFGNIDDSNNGMQYAISDDQNKYYRTASVTSTGTYTFGDWTEIPAGSTVENNTAEKAGIVAAGNTANSKSSVWGLDTDWNPVWKRLQELMIVDGTTPLTTEVDRVRFIKRYRWAVGLDTDETSTKTCYVLDLGGDTEGNQINLIFDYDYDLLENRGVYARYPIKDTDGDWTMSPPVKLAFSSDVSSLISEAVTELEGKINLKADIDSPALTGTPTAPTPEDSDNSTRIATTAFVKALINALVNGAPETLDTLKEVADAISENETVVEALNAAIGNKVDKVAGKGLSTNDFTEEDKDRVDDAVLLSQLVPISSITDPNTATNILSLVNGWHTDVINIPSFAKSQYAILITDWINKNEIGLLNADHMQVMLTKYGIAYRSYYIKPGESQGYSDWQVFDKRDYLPLSGGVVTDGTNKVNITTKSISLNRQIDDETLVNTEFASTGIFTNYMTYYILLDNSEIRYTFHKTYGLYNINNLDLGNSGSKWKDVYATNGVIQTSDRNEKNSFVDLSVEKAESLIYGLNPTTYMMNSGSSGRIHWGLISQDLEGLLDGLGWTSLDFAGFIKSPKMTEEVFDEKTGEIIKESEVIEGEYTYSLRYDEFIAPIIKIEQSHNERIKELETKIEQQDIEITSLKSQIEELKNLILGGNANNGLE